MRFRYVSSLVLVALVAGAIAAHADSAGAPPPARTPARVVAAPAPARTPVRVVAAPAPARTPVRVVAAPAPARPFVGVAPLPIGCAAPVPLDPRRKTPQAPTAATAAPPSQQLLDAFAILRRPRTDQDALSPAALEALRVRGLSPVSLDSSRLLRSTPAGGKAWVVPVPDVAGRLGAFCGSTSKPGSREGVVVVAVGDAASDGGGALDDLVRGRAPVTVAPCAGADHSMLSISGIVPTASRPSSSRRPTAPRCAPTSRTTATSSCCPTNARTSSATSYGPGETARPTSSPSSPSPPRGPARASPPPSWRSPRRACRPTARSGAPARRSPTSSPVPCPAGRRGRCVCAARSRRCSSSRGAPGGGLLAPGVVVTGRPLPAPPVAVLPVHPAPPVAVVPAQPVPAPATPAPAPPRKHR